MSWGILDCGSVLRVLVWFLCLVYLKGDGEILVSRVKGLCQLIGLWKTVGRKSGLKEVFQLPWLCKTNQSRMGHSEIPSEGVKGGGLAMVDRGWREGEGGEDAHTSS